MGAARKISEADRVLILDAYLTREPVHRIAKRFRIHTKTVAVIARSFGAPYRRALSKKQTIIRLFQEGVPVCEIARSINSRNAYVNQVATECGLQAPDAAPATQRGSGTRAVQEVWP